MYATRGHVRGPSCAGKCTRVTALLHDAITGSRLAGLMGLSDGDNAQLLVHDTITDCRLSGLTGLFDGDDATAAAGVHHQIKHGDVTNSSFISASTFRSTKSILVADKSVSFFLESTNAAPITTFVTSQEFQKCMINSSKTSKCRGWSGGGNW